MNSCLAPKLSASITEVHGQLLVFTVLVTVNSPCVSNLVLDALLFTVNYTSSRSCATVNPAFSRELAFFHLFSRFSILFANPSTPRLVPPVKS
ncbi:unnamed protein product [Linum trigynum]|uniref:Secreted protein n=1 Tax=Linum trigynum TaxID=586398 RepID=A0AAV2F8M9_9ROSI